MDPIKAVRSASFLFAFPKALRRDCICKIENTDQEIGVSGLYLHLLLYFDTHRCSSLTGSFYTLCINLLN